MKDPLLEAIIIHAQQQYRVPKLSSDLKRDVGCLWGPRISLTVSGRDSPVEGYVVPTLAFYHAIERAEQREKAYQFSERWTNNSTVVPEVVPEYRLMFRRIDENGLGPLVWTANTLHDQTQGKVSDAATVTLFLGDVQDIDTTEDLSLFHRIDIDSIRAWQIVEVPLEHEKAT